MTMHEKLSKLNAYCREFENCHGCKLFTDKAKNCGDLSQTDKLYEIVFGADEPTLKDSGERRKFLTGAVRDCAEGKGDMFSLPAAAIIRVSKHYEQGAKKYNRLNYQKGIPISAFMDSALRHIFKYLDGWNDEDHLSAAAFNVLGAIQMEERNPEMQDVEARKGACGFEYGKEAT